MPDKHVMDALDRCIGYLQDITPDVFFSAVDVGYVKAWKYHKMFYLDCRRVDGAYYHGANFDSSQIVPVCKRYFDALLSGEDLLGVLPCCTH